METKNLSKIIRQLQGHPEYRCCKHRHNEYGPGTISDDKSLRSRKRLNDNMFIIPTPWSVIKELNIESHKRWHISKICIYKTSAIARNIVVDFDIVIEENLSLRDASPGYIQDYQLSLGPACLTNKEIALAVKRYDELNINSIRALSLLSITEEHVKRAEPIVIFGKTYYLNHGKTDKSWYKFTENGMTKIRAHRMINLFHTPVYLKQDEAEAISNHTLKRNRLKYDS